MAVAVPKFHCKNIGRFKFGNSVRDHHARMKYWQIFILYACTRDKVIGRVVVVVVHKKIARS